MTRACPVPSARRSTLGDVTIEPWREGPIPDDVLQRAHRAVTGRGRTPRLPRVGDGQTARVDLLESFAELVAVSMARAQFLGELLADQLDRETERAEARVRDRHPTEMDHLDPAPPRMGDDGDPVPGLIGFTYSPQVVGPPADQAVEMVPVGEEIRALVKLEAEERDRAAKLIERALKIGVTLQQLEMLRTYGTTIAAALQTFAVEVGLSLDDEPVLRAAQRAGLTARRTLGQDDGDPDRLIGPRMAPGERVSALREALRVAEADEARTREVTR